MPIEMSPRVSVLVWIPSFCRSVVTVVRYYMKYTRLLLGPSPPISFLDVLLIVRGASRVESEQKLWVLVRFWRRKKCKTVGNFLFWFALYHARYVFIKVTNDIVYYREGGRQYCFMSLSALLFDRLGSSACCHWTAENLDHILEFCGKMNLDSLQEGLIPERKRFPEAISLSLYTGLQRAAKQSACQHHKREHVYSDHFGQK